MEERKAPCGHWQKPSDRVRVWVRDRVRWLGLWLGLGLVLGVGLVRSLGIRVQGYGQGLELGLGVRVSDRVRVRD